MMRERAHTSSFPSGGSGTGRAGGYIVPPHTPRLLRRLATLGGPVVQIRSWPGCGLNGILRALCAPSRSAAREGAGTLALPAERLGDREAIRSALAEGRLLGAGTFVVFGPAPERLDRWGELLAPGERLLVAGLQPLAHLRIEIETVAPAELFLLPDEVAVLWAGVLGEAGSEEECRALWEATGGWYRPLLEVLLTPGGAERVAASQAALLELEGVAAFLRSVAVPAAPSTDDPALPPLLARFSELSGREEGKGSDGGGSRPSASVSLAPRDGRGAAGEVVYTVSLLGTAAIHRSCDGTERPVSCTLRRSLQALAYLATSPDLRANRDELVGALWPNEGERTIERNFHPTLSHLRRSLSTLNGGGGEEEALPILFRGGAYQLNPAIRWEIDARQFLALAESCRRKYFSGYLAAAAADGQAAWRLYRGPFLQGFFDLWVAERREHLQQQYLDLLRDVGELSLRLELPEEALDAFRAVLADDPLQERVHVSVMRLYAAQGRRDLVKKQYDRLCSLLLEELGVAPLSQTTEDFHLLMG